MSNLYQKHNCWKSLKLITLQFFKGYYNAKMFAHTNEMKFCIFTANVMPEFVQWMAIFDSPAGLICGR